MCVVNKQFELLGLDFNSVYVDLKDNYISLTFTLGYVCLCGVCSHVVVHGLSVRLPCACMCCCLCWMCLC